MCRLIHFHTSNREFIAWVTSTLIRAWFVHTNLVTCSKLFAFIYIFKTKLFPFDKKSKPLQIPPSKWNPLAHRHNLPLPSWLNFRQLQALSVVSLHCTIKNWFFIYQVFYLQIFWPHTVFVLQSLALFLPSVQSLSNLIQRRGVSGHVYSVRGSHVSLAAGGRRPVQFTSSEPLTLKCNSFL